MQTPEDKWVDDALAQAMAPVRSKPDFERWKKAHPQQWSDLKHPDQAIPTSPLRLVELGRLTIKSPVARAAVVLLIVGIAITSWHSPNTQSNDHVSSWSFLSIINTAYAAEQTLFSVEGIVHIVHEITLYPNTDAPDLTKQLDELIDSNFSRNKDAAFMRAWFSSQVWLPVHSLAPDGELRWHKLELAKTAEKANSIQEHIWYDPASGYFTRVFKQQEQVLFALSYDGEAVYLAQASDNGRFEVQREAITEQFQFPDNPAEFLGISASFQGSMDMRNLPPVETQRQEQLADGTPVQVYKLRWQETDAYHVFKVHAADNTIEEIESVAYGRTIQQIQRLSSDAVGTPDISWDLTELAGQGTQGQSEVTFKEGVTEITAQQMVDRALVETYAFGRTPDWIAEQRFIEVLDEASPVSRMFMVLYRATDGRHIVLAQGSTIGQYLESALGMVKKAGFWLKPQVFASNRFKLHVLPNLHYLSGIGNEDKREWSIGHIFKETRFELSEYSSGYVMHSPTNTDFVLLINGRVSYEELEDLVDSLVPVQLYVESGDAVEWYVDTDLNCVTYHEFEPGAFMKEWLVLGSIPVEFNEPLSFWEKFRDGESQERSFDEDPFDIHTFSPVVTIDGQDYHWQYYGSPSEIVDLGWPLGQKNYANAYALAQIEMSQDTPVVLAIGDDDRIKVWLNGQLVHEDRVGGHVVPDKALIPVTLHKGINRLLLKVQNGITEWQFTFRVFEAGYHPQGDEMKPELSSVTYDGLQPGKFMKKWLLLDPAPACAGERNWAESKAAFDEQHLTSLEHFEPTVHIDGKDHGWTAYQSYTGIVDIHRAWPQRPPADKREDWYIFTYAWAQVDMPEDTTALLGIGYDDIAKVWLNGELVHDNWTHHRVFPDHYRFNVTFRQGPNQLIFKIQNRVDRWKFCCRLLETQ